jgi:ferredoxin
MRLIVDTSICRGHGQCAFVAPSVVTMGPDGKSRPAELALQGEQLAQAKDAVLFCPESALELVE